jgi:hypothetical protein
VAHCQWAVALYQECGGSLSGGWCLFIRSAVAHCQVGGGSLSGVRWLTVKCLACVDPPGGGGGYRFIKVTQCWELTAVW